jgi:hypothetical protein
MDPNHELVEKIASLAKRDVELSERLWSWHKGFEEAFDHFRKTLNNLYSKLLVFRNEIDKSIPKDDQYYDGFDIILEIVCGINKMREIEKIGKIFRCLGRLTFDFGRIIKIRRGTINDEFDIKAAFVHKLPGYRFLNIEGEQMNIPNLK